MPVIPPNYLHTKRNILRPLKVKGKDSVVYAYCGHSAADYHNLLQFEDRMPYFTWSTQTSANPNLHHIHPHKPILVKVSIHRKLYNAKQELAVHIAMVESQSCYVPMLYNAVAYETGTSFMNIMVMEHLSGVSLRALKHERLQKHGSSFVTVQEEAQLTEALKDLWAVGGVHMDLHRTNIIVTRAGQLYIFDFSRSTLLPSRHYTQSITTAGQKRRVQAILKQVGIHQPIQSTHDLDSAVSQLHGYPNIYAREDMRRHVQKARLSFDIELTIRDLQVQRANLIRIWAKPTQTRADWDRIAKKARTQKHLQHLLHQAVH